MDHRIKTGEQIRTFRLAMGISLQEFANRIHKSKSTASKYENGLISIDLDTLYDISEVLGVPLFKLLASSGSDRAQAGAGAFESRQYLYTYARNRLTRSIIDHYYSDRSNELSATFFYDVPSFSQPEKCRAVYEGHMSRQGTVVNYQFVNKRNSTEHTFLCCIESLDNAGYNMGLLSSISFTTMYPNAIKSLLTPVTLPEDEALRELLIFSKEDIKRMRKENMLTIIRE